MTVSTVLYTTERGGGQPLEEYPAEIIRYGYRLNRPGAIDFRLPLDDPKTTKANLEIGVHEAAVRRNRVEVWTGPLLTLDESDDTGNRTVKFGGEGLLAYTRKMHVTSTLEYVVATDDQFTIARGLVAHHQAKGGGDFGIDTSAGTTSGRKRDRIYYGFELKNIYEALVELAEVEDGFDLEVDPATRALNLYYPKRGIRRTDVVFDERNIRKFKRRADATSQASQILGVGAGEGDDMLLASRQNSGAVATSGLTQRRYVNKDIKELLTLQDHVDRELATWKSTPNLIAITVGTVDPPLFSYNVGDEVKIVWPSPYSTVNEFQRLVGFDVEWEAGEETAVLYLEPIS